MKGRNVREVEAGRAMDMACLEAQGFIKRILQPDWYQYPVYCFFNQDGLMTYSWDENGCNAIMFRNGKDNASGSADVVPRYSTEIAKAWRLVEVMRRDGLSIEICAHATSTFPYPLVEIRITEGNTYKVVVSATTAALAICRGFLVARGIPKIETIEN